MAPSVFAMELGQLSAPSAGVSDALRAIRLNTVKMSKAAEMTSALLVAWERDLPVGDAAWPATAVDLAKEFWTGHLSKAALLLAAAAHGVTVVPADTKEAIAAKLVEGKCRPILAPTVTAWASQCRGVPASTDIFGTGPTSVSPGRHVSWSLPEATSGDGDTGISKLDALAKIFPSLGRDDLLRILEEKGSQPTVSMTEAQLERLIDRTRGASGQPSAMTDAPGDASTPSAYERNITQCRRRVDRFEWFEPTKLCAPYMELLRNQVSGFQRREFIANGAIMISTPQAEVAKANTTDPKCIRQGFDMILVFICESELAEVRNVMLDRARFLQKVFAMDFPEHQLAAFAKEFTFVYMKSTTWCDDLKTDNFLIGKHLRKPDVLRGPFDFPTKDRKRPFDNGRNSRSPSTQSPRKPGEPLLCWSRVRLATGDCTFADCKFDHACPCCGADHAASSCPSFNSAKAEKAAEDRKDARGSRRSRRK